MKRLNIIATGDVEEILNTEKENGISFTETVRRAFSVYAWFLKANKSGYKIYVQDPDGKNLIRETQFLF